LLFTVSLNELQQIPLQFLLQRHSKDVKASLHNQIDEVKAYSIPIQVLNLIFYRYKYSHICIC
jgi:hypothetical protein